MIVVVHVFLFLCSFLDLLKDRYPIVLELLLFILFIITAFQNGTADYDSYNYIFDSQSFDYLSYPYFHNRKLGLSGQEFLFSSVISLIKLFGLSFRAFVFSFFLLVYFIKRRLFKSLRYPFISLFVVSVLVFNKDLSQWRHAMVIYLSLLVLSERDKRLSFIYPFVGFHFHSVALISYIPTFFISYLSKQNLLRSLIFGGVILVNILFIFNYFADYLSLSGKLNSDNDAYSISNYYYYYLVLIIVMVSFSFYQKNFVYLVGLIVLITGFILVLLLSFNATLAGRISEIIFPMGLLVIINNRFSLSGNLNVFKFAVFTVFFLFLYINRDVYSLI